jgi:hypothetical protein
MNLFLLDMGLPMIFPSLILMTAALVPVILVETFSIGKLLRTNFKKALVPALIANLVTTFAGIPVTWFLLTLLEFASVSVLGVLTEGNIWTRAFSTTLGAPWVAPGHNDEQWIILGAMLFLLIPYGLMSWWIETKIVQIMLLGKNQNTSETEKPINATAVATPQQIRWAVGTANLISYCLLAVFVILIFGIGYSNQVG